MLQESSRKVTRRWREFRSRKPTSRHRNIGIESLESRAMLAVTIDLVAVGHAGNAPGMKLPHAYGAVKHGYQIGKYEVTIGQYAEFLNSVARTDTYGLYNASMATDLAVAGIRQAGESGSHTYSVIEPAGFSRSMVVSAANRPITYVSWWDAARFANWMHNGQPVGAQGNSTTETGAYALDGATSGMAPLRNADAKFYIPTQNEWYKAAYYSPLLNSGSGGDYAYATQSNEPPGNTNHSWASQANYYYSNKYAVTGRSIAEASRNQNYLTDVGSFTGSASFYGTFDQSGGVDEWNDHDYEAGRYRPVRGGSWSSTNLLFWNGRYAEASEETNTIGFRLASPLINNAPTGLSVLLSPVTENVVAGAVIGTLSTSDEDVNDRFTYSFATGEGDADNSVFEIAGNTLRVKQNLNYDHKNVYSVRVRTTDWVGSAYDESVEVVVANANDAPAGVSLSALEVPENADTGTVIGMFSTADEDADETFAYSFVTGAGDAHNNLFEIVDDQLRVKEPLNFERDIARTIRVRVTDSGGLSYERQFIIEVRDVDEPPVIDHVVPPSPGTYRAGQGIRFTAVLTQPVLRTGAGRPHVFVAVGPAAFRRAFLVSGLGTNRLVFQYVPFKGDNDPDGVVLGDSLLMPEGVFLRDAQGRVLSTTVPAIATSNVLVDNRPPRIRRLTLPTTQNYGPGDEIVFVAIMTERVAVSGVPSIAFTLGEQVRQATYLSGSGSGTLLFRYVVHPGEVIPEGTTQMILSVAGTLSTESATIIDVAGNTVVSTFTPPPAKVVVLAPFQRVLTGLQVGGSL